MRISLQGYGPKALYLHKHVFTPWYGQAKREGKTILFSGTHGHEGSPMQWHFGRLVRGMLSGLNLHGKYLVTLEFEEAELKSWLKSYIDEKPEEALDLIAEMLPKAITTLKAHAERGRSDG